MRIYMIRHGRTKGNIEHRYVGKTDESILPEVNREIFLDKVKYNELSEIKKVYVSPMLRCRETAELILPDAALIEIEDFRECDFGDFEYKNYEELNGDSRYQHFIDTEGRGGFPGGEGRDEFVERCANAFTKLLEQESDNVLVMVVHGGTIMSILDKFSKPHKDYYSWQVNNLCGYMVDVIADDETGIKINNVEELCLKR